MIGAHPGDEFASLQEMIELLRSSLPALDANQHQLVGIYMLAALKLGKGEPDYLGPINRYFASKEPKRLVLAVVK